MVHGLDVYESVRFRDISVTATPAVDGIGDDQVSWVVEVTGRR